MPKPPIIRNRPFIERGGLSGRWYFIESWREWPNGGREAHVKHDIDDAIRAIITDHGGNPDRQENERA